MDNEPRYYKFSPGRNAIYWKQMRDKGIAAIGWLNHDYTKAKNQETIRSMDVTYFDKNKNSPPIIYRFSQIREGDVIYAFKGRSKVIGYGKITSPSQYSENKLIEGADYHNYATVNWIELNPPLQLESMVAMSTISELKENILTEITSQNITNGGMYMSQKTSVLSKNQILYGPPGTGKTYNTLTKALMIFDGIEIIDHEEDEDEDEDGDSYAVYKKQFDDLKSKDHIEFVTFHQSFSYEDFVEGIRAETNDKGELSYSIKDGIFKKIAIEALFSKFDEELKEPLDDLWGEAKSKNIYQNKITADTLFDPNNYDHKKLILSACKIADYTAGTGKPYVLIIDEINRGNTSRIFGELITLIEDTKRAGTKEAMDALLPYSQETFTVPDNLYIIGTMNTADRSLALIDTALRRRFDFIEMMPDVTLIKDKSDGPLVIGGDVDIQKMLETINNRIEALYDREHTIGHAFFMKLKDKPTINELAYIFKNKILPLLEEYFFEDWEKITQVLGKSDIYKDETLSEIQLGFKPSGKNYSRNDDKLAKAQTYINIYSTDPVQQD